MLSYKSNPVLCHNTKLTIPTFVQLITKFLKVFGRLCWPYLRPYNNHKIDFRSLPRVFIGYSPSHHGYCFLHLPTGRIYVSRHILFYEEKFPFAEHKHVQAPNSSNSQIPLPTYIRSIHPTPFITPSHVSPITSNDTFDHAPISPNPSISTIEPNISQSQTNTPLMLTPSISPLDLVASCTSHPKNNHIPPISSPTRRTHPMITRSQNNIVKPKKILVDTIRYPPPPWALIAQVIKDDVEPTSVFTAIKSPQWCQAMNVEFDALLRNGIWTLVPSMNVTGCKWIFCIKRHVDNSIERYKARLVAKAFHQQPGIDFGDTYSPIIKPITTALFCLLPYRLVGNFIK